MVRAFLDTCALFPRVLRDTLLDAALADLYVPFWSAQVLEELHRNLVFHRSISDTQAHRLVAAMGQVFPEAAVVGYQHLIPQMTNHPKDRHVLAAAVHAQASILVTSNLVDFQSADLSPHDITALSPDSFLLQLFNQAPARMMHVIEDQAATYRNPPMTVSELLVRLEKHAPSLPARYMEETL